MGTLDEKQELFGNLEMAPKDEKQVDKIFAGWLDDLPSLSSKVRMSPFEDNFSVVIAVSSLG